MRRLIVLIVLIAISGCIQEPKETIEEKEEQPMGEELGSLENETAELIEMINESINESEELDELGMEIEEIDEFYAPIEDVNGTVYNATYEIDELSALIDELGELDALDDELADLGDIVDESDFA